jgi:hypothetical protein
MLGRPLSAQGIAAALGTAPVVATADVAAAAGSAPSSSSLVRSEASNRQQPWQATGRVAPLVVVVSADAEAYGEWKSYPVHGGYKDAGKAARGGGGETVGKARNGVGYKGVARDLASVQRLTVIVEAASE